MRFYPLSQALSWLDYCILVTLNYVSIAGCLAIVGGGLAAAISVWIFLIAVTADFLAIGAANFLISFTLCLIAVRTDL